MAPTIDVAGRRVGAGEPVLVIAEAGVNHNGDLALALDLVDAAAGAGADAVKFQAFSAARVVARSAPKADYQLAGTDPGESQLDMLRRLELSADANAALQARCAERGVLFLSTPFDVQSADGLDALGIPAFKIGSGELTNHLLLAHVARLGRPVLLSTGMAELDEVRAAVELVRGLGAGVMVLHCVSEYPAALEDANLRAIPTMAAELGVPVGWSDHTPGTEAAVAAVALGAAVVEKHLTLDRAMEGPDHAASLEPGRFADLVRSVRRVESALGDGVKRPAPAELSNRERVRRGLVVTRDLPAGHLVTQADLDALRPPAGISPAAIGDVLGRRTARAIARGEPLRHEDLA
jgi:N-acetylneuraminate synthase/N,N'-diacetyllegionaminate synthase